MWLVYAIGACVCWSIGTIMTKSGIKRTDFEIVSALKTLVILLFAWYSVLSAGTASQITAVSFPDFGNIFLTGLFSSGAMISYHAALKFGYVTSVTATERISSVLTLILGIVIFNDDSHALLRWLGIILIAAGVMLMLTSKGKSQKTKWLVPGIISALFTASAVIIVKKELGGINSQVALALIMTVALLISLIAVFARGVISGIGRVSSGEVLYSVISAVFVCLAIFLFIKALATGTNSVSYLIMHTTTAVTVVLSWLIFKEKLSWKTACGMLLILCGVAVLIFLVGVYKF